MKRRIGVGSWIGIIVLTVLVIPALLVSQFVFPVEMILFSNESYSEFIQDAGIQAQMGSVISQIITEQILLVNSDTLPPALSNKDTFNEILENYLPGEWAQNVTAELVSNTLAYFNFQTPYSAIEIDITDLKDALQSNSSSISGEYINALVSCVDGNLPSESGESIMDYQACKPDTEYRASMQSNMSTYLEDSVARLPSSVNLVGLVPAGMFMGDKGFYWYSIMRWALRLLPFITVLLLIFTAYLLKGKKKLMRYWIGWLLMGISGITLIAALVVLVGFKQFTGMLFNKQFATLIAGFGNILLTIIQGLGSKIILWVIAIASAIVLFALILLLAAKYARAEKVEAQSVGDQSEENSEMETQEAHKAIEPETLEDIEEMEGLEGKKD